MTSTPTPRPLPEAQLGPAEKLLDLVLSSGAHLWHNRLGQEVADKWQPLILPRARPGRLRSIPRGTLRPGLFVKAAVALYRRLIEIYKLNEELFAHFASYAILETDWRDLKVACAALLLVQPRAGLPVRGADGAVEFHDDDYRALGEAMLLFHQQKSTRAMSPKAVLRIAELLSTPEIAQLNRQAGFAGAASHKPPLGRWPQAARAWLRLRERNLPMLQGLVKAGYKETIKKLARKCGYKPDSQVFFEVLGWKQKQTPAGHREVGLTGLVLRKSERFDGFTEQEVCEYIVAEKLSYKEVVGRLPRELGLTPAIMVALLPSLSDPDLRLLTPTLEGLGLLTEPEIRRRWERAIASATDQRGLNIAKNVRSQVLRDKLGEAADNAARKAVAAATADADLRVMFLIDKSGSMQGAIEQSKEALSRILAGFPADKLYIVTFDTMGTILTPKASSRAAVQHMLSSVQASGGTIHGSALRALHRRGVRIPDDALLVVIVVGDEDGEDPAKFASTFVELGYKPAALGLIVSVRSRRGSTVKTAAGVLQVPFSEVLVEQFDDPYQVPRVLRAMLDAATPAGAAPTSKPRTSWVEKVMATPLLRKPGAARP